jgi:hypothetical protein
MARVQMFAGLCRSFLDVHEKKRERRLNEIMPAYISIYRYYHFVMRFTEYTCIRAAWQS